jgi:hypothetical protein
MVLNPARSHTGSESKSNIESLVVKVGMMTRKKQSLNT